ncbi:hypothetical protein M406DRAFT_34447 [Cryphonectria parasitica EP155]|uniref:RNase P subunit Pop3 n=1 Tax=Cryphonectria parasitica (strain ATCC 38755 / EP155) TaxID=660469 RepID=A0A9P5CSZ0_CRYP1|nr:uncharacterized protein M406DRAFT_34447 [Cryphonectria parasitica EP155]KAF3770104.1 hypothetical protein M406DRAFT_34447 [Cryphonectria parasitica EP155]
MEKTKTVYQLETPFSKAEWPKITQEDQDSILDLLCDVLSPISHHRQAYKTASKGKRNKRKRKRDQESEPPVERAVPPSPAIATFVEVGLSTITRNLQLLNCSPTGSDPQAQTPSTQISPYAVIFIARSGPPSAFFSHLPQMVATASKFHQLSEPVRLVGFSKACEERLSACMGIPRVTSVALRSNDTTQARALVDFVRKTVPPVVAPWLEEAGRGKFLETKINALEAPVGQKRLKKG